MNIGEYLREQRIGQGISHEKLAKSAGVSKRSLIYWEQGAKEISLDNADRVLKALNVSLTIGAR